MMGDYQVPEGFYYINEFNPRSNYHLSLGPNYPVMHQTRSFPIHCNLAEIFIFTAAGNLHRLHTRERDDQIRRAVCTGFTGA